MLIGKDWSNHRTRYTLTLAGLVIAGSLMVSMSVYVDTYSIGVWNLETEVGPACLIVNGAGIHTRVSDINQIPGVTKAAAMQTAWSYVVNMGINYPIGPMMGNYASNEKSRIAADEGESPPPQTSAIAFTLKPGFLEFFPEVHVLETGRFPSTSTEVMLVDWLASGLGANLNSTLKYTRGNDAATSYLKVVGIFSEPLKTTHYGLYYSIRQVLVIDELLGDRDVQSYAFVDVDRSPFTPLNARVALSGLAGIDEAVRRLDPEYPSVKAGSRFAVSDIMAQGMQRYLSWISSERLSILVRSNGYTLLQAIGVFTAVSYNLSQRKTELDFFSARGATRSRTSWMLLHEILALSLLSVLPAMVLGIVVSRVGLASTDFLAVDVDRLFQAPFLISPDTVLLAAISCLVLPIASVLGLRMMSSARRTLSESRGRLARFTSVLGKVKWETVFVAGSLISLLGLQEMGGSISKSPFLLSILLILPSVFYIGTASLGVKLLRAASARMTRFFSPVIGRLHSNVGIKRIDTDLSGLAPAVIAVSLALCLIWTANVTSMTIPQTTLAQTRFAIGGDVTFMLDKYQYPHYSSFAANVTSHAAVYASSILAVQTLYLTTSLLSSVAFVSVDSDEYADVGFDEMGLPLGQSNLRESLDRLKQEHSGAVISSDLSQLYALRIGDTLRGFLITGSVYDSFTFTVVDIVDALPELRVDISGYTPPSSSGVGLRRVWINSDYGHEIFNVSTGLTTYVSVRLAAGHDGLELVDDLMSTGGEEVFRVTAYAVASAEARQVTTDLSFVMNTSVDTMMFGPMVFLSLCAITLCGSASLTSWRRETALLKSMGMEQTGLARAALAETLAVSIFILLLSLVTLPVTVTTDLLESIATYGAASAFFPVVILVVIPFLSLSLLSVCFLGIIGLAFLRVRSYLAADALDSDACSLLHRAQYAGGER